MSDFLIHEVYGTILQNLPTLLLCWFLSWQLVKAVFKNREAKPVVRRLLIVVATIAFYIAFLSL